MRDISYKNDDPRDAFVYTLQLHMAGWLVAEIHERDEQRRDQLRVLRMKVERFLTDEFGVDM